MTQENIKIKKSEYTAFPIKLNKTSNETEMTIDKIKIKLTGTAPVYNLYFELGHNYTFPFEIFFEVPLTEPTTTTNPDNKEKIITGTIISSLAVIGVVGGTIFYKRKGKK